LTTAGLAREAGAAVLVLAAADEVDEVELLLLLLPQPMSAAAHTTVSGPSNQVVLAHM
jgi:hypothetical protein